MLKKFTYLFAVIALVILVFGDLSERKKQHDNTLKIGVSADYPPFEYVHEGKIIGLDIDLIKEIATRLNRNIEIVEMDFAGLMLSVQSGKVDAVISNISVNEERKKIVDFSVPYYTGSIAAISLENMNISNSDHLAGKTVGVQLGSTMHEFIESHKHAQTMKIVTLHKMPALLQELKLGRVDVVLLDETQVKQVERKMPEISAMIFSEAASEYAIAFKKDSSLANEFNAVINELIKEGFVERLRERWAY